MSLRAQLCALLAAAVFFCTVWSHASATVSSLEFSNAGAQAADTLLHVFYSGDGLWHTCNEETCRTTNSDWGADSATYTLYLQWLTTHDPRVPSAMTQLESTAPRYPTPCTDACPAWSDTPAWDAVALMREYDALGGNPESLEKAKAAIEYVVESRNFSRGACPELSYQQPRPSNSRVKTLETDANVIKASLLVYNATHDRVYLNAAISQYADDRKYYFDRDASLYTVHVIDDGNQCTQVPRRFFASVNGDMISNGLELWRITGQQQFYDDAIATARAVDANLSDAQGVFADLQGENDVVEPLVEAMYSLAEDEHLAFARAWILRNAAAALSARGPDGTFSRFFDGPPQTKTSIWESNGGLALEIAAASLSPNDDAEVTAWRSAQILEAPVDTLPATITFNGAGIALSGKMSALCEKAHVRVLIDGVETFDHTGLWQNYSMPRGNSVFFVWRWPTAGRHVIQLIPTNSAETVAGAVQLQSVVLPAERAASTERIGE